MRPWVEWCFTHRMGWVVFLLLALAAPLYAVLGAWEILSTEYRSEWRALRQWQKLLRRPR